jgi:protein-S-isoprenylcysteine O-methyltransferase Ste14
MRPATLEKWVWLLIYAGLLLLCLGVFVQRLHDPVGWTMIGVGIALAVAGAVGIWWRSRMNS